MGEAWGRDPLTRSRGSAPLPPSHRYTMTMTNKIKDVELVWTLGAMLAKSAELANGGGGGGSGFKGGLLLLVALAAVYYLSRRQSGGYRHVSTPLHTGHESD